MQQFVDDIVTAARDNTDFRRVVATGSHSQVVLMAIDPGSEIGEEVHDDVDQVLVVVEGEADAVLDGASRRAGPGHLVFVPAGVRHNIVNAADATLRLYTLYAPPEHPDGTVHRTKAEADADEHHH